MSSDGSKEFNIINKWLGWGDPVNGLWFIGVEEGAPWKCKNQNEIDESRQQIKMLSDSAYSPYANKIIRGDTNWPIAVVTAKISSGVSKSELGWRDYREDVLWLNDCKVFNGNLLSLGKQSLNNSDWPEGYKELFGFTADEYDSYYENVKKHRYVRFQESVKAHNPQAIVCFGMSHWDEFERVFIGGDRKSTEYNELKTKVFDKDRVILTRHFSNGMPDTTVDFIVNQLLKWKVSVK